jgi:hypothetical protein
VRAWPLLLALAACDYQPRPGSEPATRAPASQSATATAGAACQLTLGVDGMT